MEQSTLSLLRKWFARYARGFLTDEAGFNVNIRLKIRHTARVCRHMAALADSQGLDGGEKPVAGTIALLHDVGRFRQYRQYRSFDDRVTEDHARLAVEVIEEEGCLAGVTAYEGDLIVKAVSFHNRLRLPDNEEERVLFYARMIRDADKLDIFGLVSGYYDRFRNNPNPAIDFGLPATDGYRREFVRDILQNRLCDNRFIENLNDVKLLRLSWVFDLNFPYSLAHVKKTGYIGRIMKHLPTTKEMREVHAHLLNYLEEGTGGENGQRRMEGKR